MRVVYNASDDLCRWAGLKLFGDENCFFPAKAIGIENNGGIVAGIVYNNYITDMSGNPLLCEMTIVSTDKRWATRQNLKALFVYPFIQLGLERVQALCSVNDIDVQSFLARLGFVYEGTHRRAYQDRSDAMSFAMLKHECKWIKNGKEITKSTSRT